MGAEEVDKLVNVRMARQSILTGDEPIRLWTVVDEAALRRGVGGPGVMREQIEHILTVCSYPRVTVQVLPQPSGTHSGMLGSFSILGFPASTDPGLIYVEYRTGAMYLEQPSELKDHQTAFEHLRLTALKPEPSRSLLKEIMEELR